MTRIGATLLLFLGIVTIVPASAHAQIDGNRRVLCVKKIGKSNIKGRDSYLASAGCRKGYFAIDLTSLASTNSIPGETGPAGKDGAAGPQGIQGDPGDPAPEGSVFGEVTVCTSRSRFDRDVKVVHCSLLGTSFSFRHVFRAPGEGNEIRFDGIDTQAFKIFNIPAGSYVIQCDNEISPDNIFFTEIFEVVVNEGEATDVGTLHADRSCGEIPV